MQTKKLKDKQVVPMTYLFLCIAAFVILFNVYSPLAYLSGLKNSVVLFAIDYYFDYGVFICILYLITNAIINVVLVFRKTTSNKATRLLIIGFTLVVFSIVFIADSSPWYIQRAYGFRDRMQQTADIKAIRNWLLTLGPPENPDVVTILSNYNADTDKELPDFVRNISADHIYVNSYEHGNHANFIFNGGSGAIGAWGFVVMPSDIENPPSYPGKEIFPVGKGAYVWQSE